MNREQKFQETKIAEQRAREKMKTAYRQLKDKTGISPLGIFLGTISSQLIYGAFFPVSWSRALLTFSLSVVASCVIVMWVTILMRKRGEKRELAKYTKLIKKVKKRK